MSAKAAWARIPEHLRGGIARYLIHGLRTGDFLQALIRNDLRSAVARADETALQSLRQIVQFFHNYAPPQAYGHGAACECWFALTQSERLRLVRSTVEDAFEAMLADSGIAFGVPSDGRAV